MRYLKETRSILAPRGRQGSSCRRKTASKEDGKGGWLGGGRLSGGIAQDSVFYPSASRPPSSTNLQHCRGSVCRRSREERGMRSGRQRPIETVPLSLRLCVVDSLLPPSDESNVLRIVLLSFHAAAKVQILEAWEAPMKQNGNKLGNGWLRCRDTSRREMAEGEISEVGKEATAPLFTEEDDAVAPFHWIEGDSLAPPCQTDPSVLEDMMELIRPILDRRGRDAAVVYDLGCGDGRICITSSFRFGVRSVGVEIEEVLVERFRSHVTRLRLEEKVRIIQGDLREVDLADATIIFLYLLPEAIALIAPSLEQALRRGAVLVCNTWGPKGLQPVQIKDCGQYQNVRLHVYTQDSLPC